MDGRSGGSCHLDFCYARNEDKVIDFKCSL